MTRIADFIDAACQLGRYNREEFLSSCREYDLVVWRHRAIYLAVVVTGQSTTTIGRSFCRDHTSVIWARRRVDRLMNDPAERKAVARLAFKAAEIAAARMAKQAERMAS